MSIPMALGLGIVLGAIFATLLLSKLRNGKICAEYEKYIAELELEHQQAIEKARKQSVKSSRAVLKGKVAEQFAPIFPNFPYLPANAKFLGDPIDYVVFHRYHEYREGLVSADQIEVIFIDIKSGQARLHDGQKAIAEAIQQGRVRFETVRIDF